MNSIIWVAGSEIEDKVNEFILELSDLSICVLDKISEAKSYFINDYDTNIIFINYQINYQDSEHLVRYLVEHCKINSNIIITGTKNSKKDNKLRKFMSHLEKKYGIRDYINLKEDYSLNQFKRMALKND